VSWAGIIGQRLAVRLLSQAVAGNKVAHAYLFAGPEGVGKRTVALELARALNCLSPQPDGSACDTCTSCAKIAATPPVHPDVLLIEPDGRFIKTDQMKQMQAEMYARPNEGRVRVAIIDGADRMNAEAGNRVLKLLEEPPGYAVMILLTSNLAGVLPTLISRCQVVNFPPLGTQEVAQALQGRGLGAGEARLYASLSGGSLGRALALAQDQELAQRRNETRELLGQIDHMDDFALVTYAERLDKEREHLQDWLELLTVWLRDALLVAQTDSADLVVNADRIADVEALARRLGASALLAMLAAVTDTVGQLNRNVNVRLALDVLLLRLSEIARAQAPV
jgi:DNA polymerase-3 subunit delta'